MSLKNCILSCFGFIIVILSAATFASQPSQLPTSTPSTSGIIPVISDFEMQQCTKLFQKSEEAYKKLLAMPFDPENEKLVKAARNQYDLHNRMVVQFNQNCAGKQSVSSCEKTKKMREESGLSYQDCQVTKR